MTEVKCDRCGVVHRNPRQDVRTVVLEIDFKDGEIQSVVPSFDLCKQCRADLRWTVRKFLKKSD